jgi:hypothetical protein
MLVEESSFVTDDGASRHWSLVTDKSEIVHGGGGGVRNGQ